jgi:hypothetical protein
MLISGMPKATELTVVRRDANLRNARCTGVRRLKKSTHYVKHMRQDASPLRMLGNAATGRHAAWHSTTLAAAAAHETYNPIDITEGGPEQRAHATAPDA